MTTKQKYTTESVMVYPIDTERIAREHAEREHSPATVKWYTPKLALVKVPHVAIIDEEFVGGNLTDTVDIYLWKEEHLDDHSWRSSCGPELFIRYPIAELDPYLLPAVSLAEFTKARRGYNSRICSNEAAWLRAFNF